ncbi:MAG: AI-2E family transporter [Verrucomicrobiota bacterium]
MSPSNLLKDYEPNPGARFLIVAAALVLVVAGLKLAATVLVPFCLAFFIAVLSLPLVFWLKKKKIPRPLAILIAVFIDAAAVSVIALLAVASVSDFESKIDKYEQLMEKRLDTWARTSIDEWKKTNSPFIRYLNTPIEELEELGEELSFKDLFEAVSIDSVADSVHPGTVWGVAQGAFQGALGLFSKGFLVLLILIFFLAEASNLPDKLRYIYGVDSNVMSRFETITKQILSYLIIKSFASITTGILVGLGAFVMRLDFPILWGLIAFALNYIPTIGSILAAIPAVILAMVQYGLGHAIGIAIWYVAINISIGNFIEPMLLGRKLGLSTLVVILSLVFWGWVWGPIGMFLSVPLTMILKIVMLNTPDFQWAAALISNWPMAKSYLDEELTSDAKNPFSPMSEEK